jgi:flagellum-specific peptidoglycan hydrolase FlgJ
MDLRKNLAPFAEEVGAKYRILPSFIMAVAYLETGNGSSTLCNDANNLFSIKGQYEGKSVTLPTNEYYSGSMHRVNAQFKKYPTFRESCIDFCELIKNGVSWNHQIYSNAVIGKTNFFDVAVLFGKTPYMTDPAYSSKLVAVYKSYRLDEFDTVNTSGYDGHSIVEYLQSIHQDASFTNRARLAVKYGISHYNGSAAQNNQLLEKMRGTKK